MKFNSYLLVSVKLLLTGLWLVLMGYVAAIYLPHNPLTPQATTKRYLRAVLPEGWGFFTKNPQDPDIYLYSLHNGEWVQALRTPNSSFRNLCGIKRDARAQGAEYGKLLNDLSVMDNVQWTEYKNITHSECMDQTDFRTVSLVNKVKSPTLCGDIIVILQKPVPWSWTDKSINMPMQAIKLKVRCNDTF